MKAQLWMTALLAFLFLWPGRVSHDLFEADQVIVRKADRRLVLLRQGMVFAAYDISLGAAPVGHKQQEGDERTPEGYYRLDGRNASSGYYRSLHISYPNDEDRSRAATRGVDPGGDVMIHGQRNYFGWAAPLTQLFDWTNGCIAVDDTAMREIWSMVPDNTPIEIMP